MVAAVVYCQTAVLWNPRLIPIQAHLETSGSVCDDTYAHTWSNDREDQMTKTISVADTTLELVEPRLSPVV